MSEHYRFELKYPMRREDAWALEADIKRFGMRLDTHIDPTLGYYIVTSLYFDSLTNQHYDDKAGGIIKRRKIRLRCYGPTLIDADKVTLEIKNKYELKNQKVKMKLTPQEAQELIEHGPEVLHRVNARPEDREAVLRSIYEINAKPSIYVRYKRKAYMDSLDDLRITFDYDIEGTPYTDRHLSACTTPVNHHQVLLEVKYQYALPPWFGFLIRQYDLEREAHSKFSLCTEQVFRYASLLR